MKRVYYCLLAFIVFSCGDNKPSKPYKALIPVKEGSEYFLKAVTYKTLEDPQTVSGTLADIYGGIDIFAGEGLIAQQTRPSIRYIIDEKGVMVPLDFHTMSMLTIYYHIEQVVDFWTKEVSLSFEEDIKKSKIYYEPDVEGKLMGSIVIKIQTKTNESFSYDSKHNYFRVYRNSSAKEKIPIRLSLNVFAHEFGHKLQFNIWAGADANFEKTSNKDSKFVHKAIGEGFADFCSYVVTEDENILESFSSVESRKNRVLPVGFTQFYLDRVYLREGSNFYLWGSLLASALYLSIKERAGNESLSVAKIAVAKEVISAMRKYSSDWKSHKEEADFSYFYLIKRIIDEGDGEANKEIYCKHFEAYFNNEDLSSKCGGQ
jgi:hypothetical protein